MVEKSKDASRSTQTTGLLSRLLLVDDDTALLTALADTIEFHLGPVLFDVCDSGAKALGLVRANRYDAIIVDMNMPNMSGLEFLVVVKQLRRDIPVLMISGHASEALIASALEAGASDFIPKPFDRNKIVSAVRPAWNCLGLVRDKHLAVFRFLWKQKVFIPTIAAPT